MKLFSIYVLVVSSFLIAGKTQAQTVTSGLISAWNFDETSGNTAADSSGGGHTGTLYSSPKRVTGVEGMALDFSNGSAYVAVQPFNLPSSLTVQAWIHPQQNTGVDSIVLNDDNNGIDVRIDGNGHLSASWAGRRLTDTTFNFYGTGNLQKWYNIAYTFDSSAKKYLLYRDGAQVAAGVVSGTVSPTRGRQLWIGRHSEYNFGSFGGALDSVFLYNRALSATEINTNRGTSANTSVPVISSFNTSASSVTSGSPVTLSWTAAGASLLAITPGSTTSTQTSGSMVVYPTATTSYTLTASNTAGSVTKTVVVSVTSAKDTTAPTTPTSLSATAVSSSSVSIAWQPSTDNVAVTGYRVYRNGVQSATVQSGTGFQDSGLQASTTYSYTVSAYDAAGNTSAQSSPVTVTTSASQQATAQNNGIVIKDESSTGQTNRPFSISRVFAKGEFPTGSFPQARIGGAQGSTTLTQVDVKNTWPDGSIKHAIVSFRASVPPSSSINVDFVPQSSSNNSGALDKNGMLSFAGAGWGAQIELTNGSTVTANARSMISAWNGTDTGLNGSGVRYWLKGPIVTQVIVEDRSSARAYDVGWDQYKPLHPIFVLSFYPNTSVGVKTEYIVENMWSGYPEDQQYSLVLKTGASNAQTAFSKATFTHTAFSRWRQVFWSGTTPTGWTDEGHTGVMIDYNFPYIIASRALPSYDLTKVVDSTGIATALSQFNATDKGVLNGVGQWIQYMPQTGGRDDIGLLPLWYVRYLYSMSVDDVNTPQMYGVMIGNAEVSGYVPFHIRENRSDAGAFCGLSAACMSNNTASLTAIGRPSSIDAYPQGPNTNGGGATSTNGWTVDSAHTGNYAYIPYLITGDWYFLEEMYFWSAYDLEVTPPGTALFYQRHDDWGYIRDQIRGDSWSFRHIGETAFMAPDGAPEQAYFEQKLLNNIAVREGRFNITTGYGYTNDNTKWLWGSTVAAATIPASGSPATPNPLNFWDYDEYASLDNVDPTYTHYPTPQWQVNFMIIVLGHLEELGFPTTQLRLALGDNFVNQILNPSYNPYLMGEYRTPAITAASGDQNLWFTNWAAVKSAFSSTEQNRTTWLDNSDSDPNDGYANYARAAASFLPDVVSGTYTGTAALNWLNANVCCQSYLNNYPKWAFVPRKN